MISTARLDAAERALDVASANVDAALASLRAECAVYAAAPQTRRAVLVVEDHDASQRLIARILAEIANLEIEAARTCEEAEEILARPGLPPRVVLLDVRLPGRPGYLLAPSISRVVQVILMSGAVVGDLLASLAAPDGITIAGWIEKPFKAEDLLRLVRRALGDA